jgi:hypothetical protein
MMVSRVNMQDNVGSELPGVFVILHILNVFSFIKLMVSVCEPKNLNTDLTMDWIQNPLNESLEF